MDYDLQRRLDAFLGGECSLAVLVQELAVLCDTSPESAWDVLSLVDQYYRRGKLPADLFRTIKNRIEQQVLGVPGADTVHGFLHGPTGTESPDGAARGGAVAILATQEQPVSRKEPQSHAPRSVHRFRERFAVLADLGRRTRAALAATQRKLGVWAGQARDSCERLTAVEWRRSLREHVLPPCVVFGVLATVLLGIDSSPLPQEPPKRPVGEAAIPPTAAAAVTPQRSEPGQISLSADRYLVFPGDTSAEIEVHRTAGVNGDVSFVWWTQASAGARPARDYVSRTPRTALLPDGVDTLRLSVPILANPSRKHTELFYVVIGKPGGGASLGSIRRATVFIMRPG